jgi:hypothetical protein
MHEFSADRNHAVCNIQNRTIPVIIHSETLSVKKFKALAFLSEMISAKYRTLCSILQDCRHSCGQPTVHDT